LSAAPRLGSLPGRLLWRLKHPRTTVRGRLTLLYGGLFLFSGVILLALLYGLVRHEFQARKQISVGGATINLVGPTAKPLFVNFPALGAGGGTVVTKTASGSGQAPGSIKAATLLTQIRATDLHLLFVVSSISLAVMTIVSALLGWLVAGRVLRPLRAITNATQQISEDNLHRRLALPGPDDELKDLSNTIDGLLARLETAFTAQRNFVANASHELRTPLTVSRAMLQVALADPELTLDSLRAVCEDVLDAGRQQEQLIEALLTLARSQRGLDRREPLDLATVATEVAQGLEPAATTRGLTLAVSAVPAPTSGDPQLVARLVSNLIENGVHHNLPGGNVRVEVHTQGRQACLGVSNTGPPVPADQIPRLLQPFQRNAADRVKGHDDGLGLGLSIVAAIANAHRARLTVRPGRTGGLDVRVLFPPPAPPRPPDGRDGNVQGSPAWGTSTRTAISAASRRFPTTSSR
jgi:signal transduction histidine kinase